MKDNDETTEVLLGRLTPEQIGERYVFADPDRDEDQALILALFDESIDPEIHLRMVVAAINSASTDDELWQLGDGPVDTIVATRPDIYRRLTSKRSDNERVDALWRVMLAYDRDVIQTTDSHWHQTP